MLRFIMGIGLIAVGAFAVGTLIFRTFRMNKSQLGDSVFGPKPTWPTYALVVSASLLSAGYVGHLSEAHWIWLVARYAVLLIAIGYLLFLRIRAGRSRVKSVPEGQ